MLDPDPQHCAVAMHGVIGDAERLAEDPEAKGGEWEGRAGRQEDENRDQGGRYYD